MIKTLTFKDTRDPAGLHFSLGHDGSKSVDETHNSQSGMLQVGRKNMLVEPHTVARLVYNIAWQVWKIIVVACGEHNDINLQQERDKLGMSLSSEIKRYVWQHPWKQSPLTFSTVLPSSNTTVEPRISFTFGLTTTDPDRIFKGRSSLITGIWLKSLMRRQRGQSNRMCLTLLSNF